MFAEAGCQRMLETVRPDDYVADPNSDDSMSLNQAEQNGLVRRPKLLVLASTYPRWHGDPEPAFVHELAKRLVGRFDVTVLCPHSPGAVLGEELDGVRIVRYRYAPMGWETLVNDGGILGNLKRSPAKWLLVPGFLVAQWVALLSLKRNWSPDIVHSHWLLPQGMIAVGAGMSPIVVTSHGADLFALKVRLFKWLRKAVVTRAAAVTVVSDAMRMRLFAECPETTVLRMPMGVDFDECFAIPKEAVRSTNSLLFVGRLVEKKGLIYLIEALPAVLDRHPDTQLDIVGFGPEREFVVQRVQQLGLESCVRFVGAVSHTELARHYQSASVLVAPFIEAASGDQEGLGLVVAEALGCGCPVIAGDVPAVHDLIDDTAGWIVPQRDVVALATAIIRILNDPASAEQYALLLREKIQERFSWASVANGYANLFNSLIVPSDFSHE